MMLTATVDIDYDLNKIVVDVPFRAKDAIKSVPGARWNTDLKKWTTPLSWAACLALRAEFGAGLTIQDELLAWATDIRDMKTDVEEQRASLTPIEGLPALSGFEDLFEHQKSDALIIQRARGRFLNLNETGTGKTRSVCAGLSLLDHHGSHIFPAMIVAPKSVVINWQREIEPFFPGKTISVVQGTPAKVRTALEPGSDIYIIGWDALRKYSRLAPFGSKKMTVEQKIDKEIQALGLRTIVGDEIHRSKTCDSQRTRAFWAVAQPCVYRIGLTGTPVQETPADMFGILRGLFPEEFPTKTSFTERYLDSEWNMWGGLDINGLNEDHRAEFFQIFDSLSRRLTKEVVLPWLPPKVEETRYVTLPSKLRKAYDSMKDDFVSRMKDSTIQAENAMVQVGRLVQLANAWGEIDADGVLHMEMPSPKIEAFLEDAEDGDFDGHKVVVFSDSRQLIDLLEGEMAKKKMSFVCINGDVTGDARQEVIDKFQAGDADFCLLTRAGGEGITLTAADIMVRLVRPWSSTVDTQVEDRVHRIGAEMHDEVTYIDYVTLDTVEEYKIKRLKAKGAAAQEVLRDDEIREMLLI